MPITALNLQDLIVALEHTVSQYPVRLLLRALFLVAFHAFLTLGEITAKSVKCQNGILQKANVNFNHNGSRIEGVQIVLREYELVNTILFNYSSPSMLQF